MVHKQSKTYIFNILCVGFSGLLLVGCGGGTDESLGSANASSKMLASTTVASDTNTPRAYYIDPSAALNGDGTQAKPFNSWTSVSLQPGNTYLQKRETTYNAVLRISAQGTPSSPIIIDAYGTGTLPTIRNVVLFDNASNVFFQNFSIANAPTFHSVIVRNKSHHITLKNTKISYAAAAGLAVNSDAGCNNIFESNTITNSASNGISIDKSACTLGTETVISKNIISDSGTHGIELNGNYYIVDRNVIHDSGMVSGGSSGIHSYGGGVDNTAPDGMGNFNIIRNNVVYHNHEPIYYDGNGIQLDQYTHSNEVYKNLVFGNDGQGIIAFDSQYNRINDNVIFSNVVNTNGKHADPIGNLANSTSTFNAKNESGSANNSFFRNVIIASQPKSAALDIDSITLSKPSAYGGNFVITTGQAHYYHSSGHVGENQTIWNTHNAGNGDDVFGSIPITNITSTSPPMDFVIPASDALSFTINGVKKTLYGWRVDEGLYVR
jgi:parallel beta-helix repeat protein